MAPAATASLTAAWTPTTAATATATGTPTPSPSPTATTTPTATATATPTATPTAALAIETMRQGHYPGSDLAIEEELDPGVNYRRYIASYLSEGLRIYALLTVPSGEEPASGWPAIVFNHGYIPPDEYRTTERYVAYVDAIAGSGYIVLKPDYRGHGDSEGEAVGAYGYPDYTIDVLNAVASLKRYADVDPSRIGMWGHSMGGFLTLRCMVIGDDVRAGVIWGGVVATYPDMFGWFRKSPAVSLPTRARRWRYDLMETYGTPEENADLWAALAANSYLADLSGPLQLHHSTTDEEVPVEFSEGLVEQAQAAGVSVEIFTYAGDNHNLSASFGLAMQRSIEFFDRYVKGAGQPAGTG